MRNRNFAFTLNLERDTINNFHEYVSYLNREVGEVVGYVIGAVEFGSDNDYKHCHCLVHFKNAIELNTLLGTCSWHIEPVQSYKRYMDYMKKEGQFVFNNLTLFTEDDEIFNDLLSCQSLLDFFRLHPSLVNRYKIYESAFYSLRVLKELEEELPI